ncbi:MAG: ArnT family glycosyltransferase [Mycobacterium leprae]
MYLGVSLALLVFSGLLGARLLGMKGLWDQLLATVVISLSVLVLLSLSVGMMPGGFRPLPLTAAAGLVFLVLFVLAVRRGALRRLPLEPDERSDLAAFFAVTGVSMPVWLWQFINGLLLPPTYWDEYYYHLVPPALWAKAGQVHFVTSGNAFVAGYPADMGLVMGWSFTMTGTNIWVDLLGLPFLFAGLGVVIAYCRMLGVRSRNSFWAGLLFVTTPMVIFHAKAAYIDLPLSVLFGIALYFLTRYALDGAPRDLAVAAMAMGLLVGSKYSGPYMAIAGLIPIVYGLRTGHSGTKLGQPRWRVVLPLYFLPMLLLGGVWYLHNLVAYHNPLYPMTGFLLSSDLMPGQYRPDAFTFTHESGWVTLLKALLEIDPAPQADSFYYGFGPQLILLGIPAAVLYGLWMKKERQQWLWLLLLPILLTVASLPAKYPRYLIYLSLFLLPFAAWLLGSLNRWAGRLLKLVAVACVLDSVLVASPIYTVDPFEYNLAADQIWAESRVGYGKWYGLMGELFALKDTPMRIVAHGNSHMPYLLLGERWHNEVLYIPPTTEAEWVEAVRAAQPDLLVIETDEAIWSAASGRQEREWIASHPELFQLINQSLTARFYLVNSTTPDHEAFVQRLRAEGVVP